MVLALAEERLWLDRLLQRDLAAQRHSHEMSAEEFKGLWVSDDMAAAALREGPGCTPGAALPCPVSPALRAVAQRFGLSELERNLFLLAAVAEIDAKYEAVFAYLNGLATRRWPTIGLALRLFGESGDVLTALAPHGRLMATGLLQPLRAEAARPEVAAEFRAASAAIHFINGVEPALPPEARWISLHTDDMGPLAGLAGAAIAADRGLAIALEGEKGSGRMRAAAALARAVGRSLLAIDVQCGKPEHVEILRGALLVARLTGALPLVAVVEGHDKEAPAPVHPLARLLDAREQIVLVLAAPDSALVRGLSPGRVLHVSFPGPAPSERAALWQRSLRAHRVTAERGVPEQLAARFRLGPDDIDDAVAAACLSAQAVGAAAPSREHFFAAARRLSGQDLARLATRMMPSGGLGDLVLPSQAKARVQALIDAVCHFDIVHREWGLAWDGRAAGGIAALFQGPSGTGKTMTAGVIAAEAGLELYRIDLSGVVSKYIGETEKNLDAIFRAARRSSAVLMFDEADALFGKRAEVKDAHDRYANIEVAYLLQRIEDHDGPVILSTNLAKNIDQAFARRLNYIIEFPRPAADARMLLWQRMLRPPVPVDDDVDCAVLGRAFELTGGEIRKAALEAAYMAAADGKVVRMRHLMASATREARRQGRMGDASAWSETAEVA